MLFAAAPALGVGAFSAAIVVRLGLPSVVWLIALVAVRETVRLLSPHRSGHAVSRTTSIAAPDLPDGCGLQIRVK